MSPLRALLALVALAPAAFAVVGPNDVYQESGGIVVMEAERTPSSFGTGTDRWELYNPGETNYVSGATNEGHIEFQGNSSNGGTPKTPLTYKFKIHQGGYYHLHLRARARLDGAASDKNNDCYVKMGGATFGTGPNPGNSHLMDATLNLLTTDTKMYGASPTTWGWANELDAGGSNNKRYPVYNFVAGSTYTLTISGRSIKYNIDRIVLRRSTITASSAKSSAIPESSTIEGTSGGQAVSGLMLVNADTDQDIGPITPGGTINLAVTGPNLNVRADTDPPVVGSVRFAYDATADFMTQSGVPYSIGGDAAGDDYLPWTPSVGSHTITATPYSAASGGGTAGTPLSVSFNVVNTAPSGAPTASAGTDKSITLPTSSVVFSGSGTDAGGSISSYAWSQVSGPSGATLSGASTATLTASALVQGTYLFRLTVTDNSGLTATDDATVTVAAAGGNPIANAGTDKSITLPTSSVVLNGSGSDAGGSISSYTWSQVSGPSTATLSGASTANLTASALLQGAYIFRLTVTDNSGLSATDDAIVNVAAAASSGQSVATLMLIDADADTDIGPMTSGMTIDLAVTGANLNIRADTSPVSVGSVRFAYDANPNYMTQSGAPYTIGGDSLTDYWAWTPTLGTHTLTATPFTLSAGGGVAGSPKTIVFTVINSQLSGNPVVNAGGDQTVILPVSSVTLTGSASDGEGPIASHAWTQVSGPSTATLSGAASPVLGVSGLIEGTYTFQLTVTDGTGNTASDEASVIVLPATSGSGTVSGELKKWHKVTLSFAGPATSESATPNPFTDYRLNVTFTHPTSGKSYLVPGYYAADGNAADTSATSGNVWRVHFAPDEAGAWTYTASFRSGTNIATATTAGTSAGFFDGDSGSFSIAATDKTGIDFRGKGRLDYVGKHHLRFAETGEYFMKAGVDAPENLLAYQDFDGDFKTDGQGDTYIKAWTAHVADWQSGDPVWQGTKGKGLIGAVNYLASEGLNAFSFLTMNINGDDKNVFPYTSYGERVRLDVSRLDQWEILFEHGTKKGMHLHFKTQEIENQNLLDGGDLGNQRKLYYRELIARFGHHPALNWNLGEECTATLARKKSWAQYFHDSDPYKHPIVIHNTTNELHDDMLGNASKLTGFSLQLNATDFGDMFSMTKDFIDDSAATGRPWVVACDEPGDSQYSLRPDSDSGATTSHTNARKNALWGNIMAGGAGVEWYFGYALAHSDLTCQDFRSRNSFWDYCRHALQFLDANDVPFQDMRNQNSLVSGSGNNANRCLAKTGESYLVQLHSGGTHTLNLSAASGGFAVKWFNPRTGSVTTRPSVTGGGTVSLGSPPDTTTQDWIVFVQSSSTGATNTPPVVSAGSDKSATLSASSVGVALAGSVSDDGLPDPLALTRTWSFVSGPAAVSFTAADSAATTATFTTAGTYTLRLTSSDTQFTVSDDVQVVIALPAGGGNNPPVFTGYAATVAANQSIFLSHILILNGASDPDGDPVSLLVNSGTSAAGGSVSMSENLLTYTPPAGFNGLDTFPLTVQDGRGGTTTSALQIQVGTPTGDGITGKPAPTLERLPGNQTRIRFTGTPGLGYTFQRSINLVNWTSLANLTASGDGTVEYIDPNPPSGKVFYRLSTP
jgi:hypothetical protein